MTFANASTTPVPATCNDTLNADLQLYAHLSWWLEGVAELLIGATGVICNCIAIPILCSKKMSSIFNKLLVFLTVFDNVFLLCCILESIRKYVATSNLQQILFVHFLYQLQNIALTCSIYSTVVLAVERYLAVSRPVEYHISVTASGASPWRRVWAYMGPTMLFGFLFNFPKFFEFEGVYKVYNETEWDEELNETVVYTSTRAELKPTDMRLNENYVFYYVNLTRFVVTGIFPFCCLVFLNWGIYSAIKHRRARAGTGTGTSCRRRGSVGGAGGGHGSTSDSEENRLALVLFFIVVLFLVCNVPRIMLNFYEVLAVNIFRANVDNKCYRLPFSIMVTTLISLLLMTINASINFFIYCWINTTFRRELLQRLSRHAVFRLLCPIQTHISSPALSSENNNTIGGTDATAGHSRRNRRFHQHRRQQAALLQETQITEIRPASSQAAGVSGGGSQQQQQQQPQSAHVKAANEGKSVSPVTPAEAEEKKKVRKGSKSAADT